ncbi:immunoglobulin superfamily member 1 [Bombina bombina]|uniref:immunoglobulin superfamily member 1 n=1 Tax=Bombina bombina TaxID=8345 RepID=UPI00235AAF1A|nr:immunoglobulin superfamily member 1 [Bombina bombina]
MARFLLTHNFFRFEGDFFFQRCEPELLVEIDDPYDEIVIGDTIKLHCLTNSTEAKELRLVLNGTNVNMTLKQTMSKFELTNAKENHTGLYTCQYCSQSACSRPSEELNIYVKDTLKEPNIIVEPHMIVQPGQVVTITCSTLYSDVMFSFYKNNVLLMEDTKGGNYSSYQIKNAREKDMGQYSCCYRKKIDNKIIHSESSNPLLIQIKEIPKPSIAWEADPNGNGTVRIFCRTPSKYNKIWFQLLMDEENLVDEVTVVNKDYGMFVINDPAQIKQNFYCTYKIMIDYNYAYSKLSYPLSIVEGDDDYTTHNSIRLLLSTAIFIFMGIILYKHFHTLQRIKQPPLPERSLSQLARGMKETDVIMDTYQ